MLDGIITPELNWASFAGLSDRRNRGPRHMHVLLILYVHVFTVIIYVILQIFLREILMVLKIKQQKICEEFLAYFKL